MDSRGWHACPAPTRDNCHHHRVVEAHAARSSASCAHRDKNILGNFYAMKRQARTSCNTRQHPLSRVMMSLALSEGCTHARALKTVGCRLCVLHAVKSLLCFCIAQKNIAPRFQDIEKSKRLTNEACKLNISSWKLLFRGEKMRKLLESLIAY